MKKNGKLSWEKYRGLGGFFRFIPYFVAVGLVLSPFVLTKVNPDIWKMIAADDTFGWILPVVTIGGVFSVLPLFAVGLIIWKVSNTIYRIKTSDQEKDQPMVLREWQGKDRLWHRAIEASAGLGIVLALVVLGWAIGHQAPNYYAYPFISATLLSFFGMAYTVSMSLYSSLKKGLLAVPKWVKGLFICLVLLFVLSVINIFVGIAL